MTAREPLADGENGSPAMGSETERNQDHAHVHIDGKKGKSQMCKEVLLRWTIVEKEKEKKGEMSWMHHSVTQFEQFFSGLSAANARGKTHVGKGIVPTVPLAAHCSVEFLLMQDSL
jgi:hypothetical protein